MSWILISTLFGGRFSGGERVPEIRFPFDSRMVESSSFVGLVILCLGVIGVFSEFRRVCA